jgi:LPXTG-site transpeptidase (sortase) family protein
MPSRSSSPRTRVPAAVSAVLVGLFCLGAALGRVTDLPKLSSLLWGELRGGSSMGHSVPTRIQIPSLGVRAPVVEVGWADDGSIAAPTTEPATSAGWFRLGPTPGEQGMSVIVGHIDTESKPALFHNLSQLGEGKLIEVQRSDGRTATFTVRSVETFAKTAFPADRIFAETDQPGLALVTCGGAWVGGDIGYADNVIVFATLA